MVIGPARSRRRSHIAVPQQCYIYPRHEASLSLRNGGSLRPVVTSQFQPTVVSLQVLIEAEAYVIAVPPRGLAPFPRSIKSVGFVGQGRVLKPCDTLLEARHSAAVLNHQAPALWTGHSADHV